LHERFDLRARPIIKKGLEAGINFLDTANMYSLGVSEQIVGRAIKDFAKREDIVLATKVFFPIGDGPNKGGLSRQHIFEQIDASLRRLQTDYVDLYQIHRWDYRTPVEETLEALNDLVRMGKVRYIGASSMFAWQFAKALYVSDMYGWARFISMQNHYNLIYREEEREMMPLCRDEGIGVIPWSPLAKGFLSGNRTRDFHVDPTHRGRTDEFAHTMYYSEGDFDIAERVEWVAGRRNALPIQVALAWLLKQPGITSPIIGVVSPQQLDELIPALDLDLSAEELEHLEENYQPKPIFGHE
jgi:aryl-alcohol dehydrogenase (NADP+)